MIINNINEVIVFKEDNAFWYLAHLYESVLKNIKNGHIITLYITLNIPLHTDNQKDWQITYCCKPQQVLDACNYNTGIRLTRSVKYCNKPLSTYIPQVIK